MADLARKTRSPLVGLVDLPRPRDARVYGLRSTIEFAPEVRELNTQSLDRFMLHCRLALD